MIHGPDVLMKYSVILDGRLAEMLDGVPKALHTQTLQDGDFVKFLDDVRNGTPEQFEEWYQLYK